MIDSIEQIVSYLRRQADLRALENDEAGILREAAGMIMQAVEELAQEARQADAYDRQREADGLDDTPY